MKYAFFSPKQYDLCGGIIYRHVDGHEVRVTAISDTEDSGCGWDDMQFVGMVTDYVRDDGRRSYNRGSQEHGYYN